VKRSGLVRRAFVYVNDESCKHQKGCEIVNHITCRNQPSQKEVVEPHENTCNKEQQSTQYDRPKINLLPTIEKANSFEFNPALIRRVFPEMLEPTTIRSSPAYRDLRSEEMNFARGSLAVVT